jgi:hypothetical protein
MKQLIVQSLEKLSTACVVVLLLAGLIIGYQMADATGAIVGLVIAFFISVVTFGMLFIALEANQNLRDIRSLLQSPPKS